MLSRAQLEEWGYDAGEYRGTAQQLAEWLEYLWFTHDDEKTYSGNSLISNWLESSDAG
jgi:hypothetical protein